MDLKKTAVLLGIFLFIFLGVRSCTAKVIAPTVAAPGLSGPAAPGEQLPELPQNKIGQDQTLPSDYSFQPFENKDLKPLPPEQAKDLPATD